MASKHSFRVFRPIFTTLRQPRLANPLFASRAFHVYSALQRIETHILSDIGEGVKEVQIIQWFVEEGAAVEEWAPLCEVQSDKASVEITSKYSGVVKKLHYERDAVVQVGDAMLDIEVEGEDEPEKEEHSDQNKSEEQPEEDKSGEQSKREKKEHTHGGAGEAGEAKLPPDPVSDQAKSSSKPNPSSSKHSTLATPAVRGLLKEYKLEITDIEGTGKDGRVMKEDVHRYLEQSSQQSSETQSSVPDAKQTETSQNLNPIQAAMFKSMTKSLSIPHFLYSDTINITTLASMRSRLNVTKPSDQPKFSYMPFIIKAVSLALNKHPLLNARLDISDTNKPKLLMRSNHNIGVAMDTPNGLLVPVIKNVNNKSIVSIAQELQRLSETGRAGKLTSEDLSGGTITVSNIGNIGGGVVGPVIVEGQLAIMGIGKIKPTPIFSDDGVTIVRADMMSTSWSADHRVVDGATMARMATLVQDYLERPETMIVNMT